MCRMPIYLAGPLALFWLVTTSHGQPPGPDKKSSGDETSPALLKLIRDHLATKTGLRPADGVTVREVEYFRGVVRVRGTVRSREQRVAVGRELEAIRGRLELNADVTIRSFDLAAFQVPGASPEPKAPPEGGQGTPPGAGLPPGAGYPYPYGYPPYPMGQAPWGGYPGYYPYQAYQPRQPYHPPLPAQPYQGRAFRPAHAAGAVAPTKWGLFSCFRRKDGESHPAWVVPADGGPGGAGYDAGDGSWSDE